MRTRRCSEREPADSLREKWNVIGGWLPSLTLSLGKRREASLRKPAVASYDDNMKILRLALMLICLSVLSPFRAAEAVQEPVVVLEPFEPSYGGCYKWDDKFSHPEEIIAPRFLYPFEMRRAAIDGEAGVLVEIDGEGYPKRLSILYSTQIEFSRAAITALKKARWKTTRGSVWFYYKAVYRIDQ